MRFLRTLSTRHWWWRHHSNWYNYIFRVQSASTPSLLNLTYVEEYGQMLTNSTSESHLAMKFCTKDIILANKQYHTMYFLDYKVIKYEEYRLVVNCDGCMWRCRASLIKKNKLREITHLNEMIHVYRYLCWLLTFKKSNTTTQKSVVRQTLDAWTALKKLNCSHISKYFRNKNQMPCCDTGETKTVLPKITLTVPA